MPTEAMGPQDEAAKDVEVPDVVGLLGESFSATFSMVLATASGTATMLLASLENTGRWLRAAAAILAIASTLSHTVAVSSCCLRLAAVGLSRLPPSAEETRRPLSAKKNQIEFPPQPINLQIVPLTRAETPVDAPGNTWSRTCDRFARALRTARRQAPTRRPSAFAATPTSTIASSSLRPP